MGSLRLDKTRTAILDKLQIKLDETTGFRLRVHSRRLPRLHSNHTAAGMISVAPMVPPANRFLYAFLKSTSHFGCGHLEVAFYECCDEVVIYAVRNIIRANAARLGYSHQLGDFSDGKIEVLILTQIQRVLQREGLKTKFERPQECVRLALDPRLLRHRNRHKVNKLLKARYCKLWKQMELSR